MLVTKAFLEKAGRRSALARKALTQAGDKDRVVALRTFLVNVGSCVVTRDDIDSLGLTVREKKFSFAASPLKFVLLDAETFDRFSRIRNNVDLEVARVCNGVIGILRKEDGVHVHS